MNKRRAVRKRNRNLQQGLPAAGGGWELIPRPPDRYGGSMNRGAEQNKAKELKNH